MAEQYMTLAVAKAEFADAKREFESEKAKHALPPGSEEQALSPLARAAQISLTTAARGYEASHEALSKLADETTEVGELRRYTICMRAVKAEYIAVIDELLKTTAGIYRKLTTALKDAAADLKAALQKAQDIAASLDLLASVVNAFAKLIPAL